MMTDEHTQDSIPESPPESSEPSPMPSFPQRSPFWRRPLVLLIAGIVLCSWCSLFSGVGGWIMGYDLGKRESRAALLPETGILITRIERDSPVDRAGISRGDTIIAINGRTVEDVVALRDELLGYAPGDSVMITYRHDLVEQATYVTLGHFPGSVNTPYLGIYYTARAESPADM